MLAKEIPKLGKGRREVAAARGEGDGWSRDGNGVDLGQVESLCTRTSETAQTQIQVIIHPRRQTRGSLNPKSHHCMAIH